MNPQYKYIKTTPVEAWPIVLDETNQIQLAPPGIDLSPDQLNWMRYNLPWLSQQIGSYVIKEVDGSFSVMSGSTFAAVYELATG